MDLPPFIFFTQEVAIPYSIPVAILKKKKKIVECNSLSLLFTSVRVLIISCCFFLLLLNFNLYARVYKGATRRVELCWLKNKQI